jgi:hypothetical protein
LRDLAGRSACAPRCARHRRLDPGHNLVPNATSRLSPHALCKRTLQDSSEGTEADPDLSPSAAEIVHRDEPPWLERLLQSAVFARDWNALKQDRRTRRSNNLLGRKTSSRKGGVADRTHAQVALEGSTPVLLSRNPDPATPVSKWASRVTLFRILSRATLDLFLLVTSLSAEYSCWN